MNDQDFDRLIIETIGRKELLDRIDHTVMIEIRRAKRRGRIRQWTRLAAFAFAVPFVIGCFVIGAIMLKDAGMTFATCMGLTLSAIILTISAVKAINVFSIGKM